MKTHCLFCGHRLIDGVCVDCASYAAAVKSPANIQGVDGRKEPERRKSTILCKSCESPYTIKAGVHKGKQRYNCRDCDAYFTIAGHVITRETLEHRT